MSNKREKVMSNQRQIAVITGDSPGYRQSLRESLREAWSRSHPGGPTKGTARRAFHGPSAEVWENPEQHLLAHIAEVLRLRAIKPLFPIQSAKRFAQDDGFVKGRGSQGRYPRRRPHKGHAPLA